MAKFKEFLQESKYEVYHDTYTSAIQTAEEWAIKQGYDLDEEEWAQDIGLGPSKPKPGKTNKFSLSLSKNGKEDKKRLQIQIYNRETNSNTYELNMYIR
jgi:hypothetical protein